MQQYDLQFQQAIFSPRVTISSSAAHRFSPPTPKHTCGFFAPPLAEPVFDRAAVKAQKSAFVRTEIFR